MKCSEVAELLKSDYLDNEVALKISREVKTHLESCASCRKLEQELLAGRSVLKKALRVEPPERVWQNIRASIASESQEVDGLDMPGFIERLKLLIWPPKPVLAWSGALTVLIVAAVVSSVFLQNFRIAERNKESESLAVYSLNEDNVEFVTGLGTNIEEYFL